MIGRVSWGSASLRPLPKLLSQSLMPLLRLSGSELHREVEKPISVTLGMAFDESNKLLC
jgi:hypothetical protein